MDKSKSASTLFIQVFYALTIKLNPEMTLSGLSKFTHLRHLVLHMNTTSTAVSCPWSVLTNNSLQHLETLVLIGFTNLPSKLDIFFTLYPSLCQLTFLQCRQKPTSIGLDLSPKTLNNLEIVYVDILIKDRLRRIFGEEKVLYGYGYIQLDQEGVHTVACKDAFEWDVLGLVVS